MYSFSLLFNALVALSELSDAFASRPILLKHKSFTFYRPAAFALAQLASDVPVIFVQVAVFDIVIYFLTNLARTPSQFFINFFVLYVVTMCMYAFFRMIGALCSSLDVATRISGISIQALIVYAGYLIPRPSMHPWLYWVPSLLPLLSCSLLTPALLYQSVRPLRY
jgi:ATP-binding cassette subfamily G (WHITE) protein 2 (SNQ2)